MNRGALVKLNQFYSKYKHEVMAFLGVIASAVIYAISIKCFVQTTDMLSGGASGIAMIISKALVNFLGVPVSESTLFGIFYLAINLPLFVLSFTKIGKEFTFFTIINVVLASVLIAIIPDNYFNFITDTMSEDILAHALFAGVLTGLSTSVALNVDASAGGVDIVSAYLGIKRGTKVGKYIFYINGGILILGGLMFGEWTAMLYTMIYIFVTSEVVNATHKRNNKKLIRVVTNKQEEISKMLCDLSHHGATILEGYGAYTKEKRYMVQSVVREEEVKQLIDMISKIDSQAFTTISNVETVRGRFVMPKIK